MKNIFLGLALILSFSSKLEAQSKVATQEVAILAAGCFWCIQPTFDKLKDKGIISTVVGYSGGITENPTYEEVSSGYSSHREVIRVVFDPTKLSYQQILEVFWLNIDPFNAKGQFCDLGDQYVSAIYYTSEEQRKVAEKLKSQFKNEAKTKAEFHTEVLPAKKFYPAEDYHQEFYKKNPLRYKAYRLACGRDKRLKEVWGK